jgi:uncharacterized membrane protein
MDNSFYVILSFVFMLTWVIHTRLIRSNKSSKFKIGLYYFLVYVIIIVVAIVVLHGYNLVSY